MGWLRMQDFLTFQVKGAENKKYLFECKDSKSPTGHSLFVKLEATHSGIVNGNARFYRPDRMQDSVHTWTPKGKPARPVLVNHDREGECIGRIHKARYVDLSYLHASEFPGVKGLCFYDSSPRKLTLFNSVDWVMRNLHSKPDYKGLGYIELDSNITDPAAIQKIQDERFLTVSVGFGTDSAACSICHTDWAVDDKCDHELGRAYDGKPMFLISGNFQYKECSFVNVGADPWAAVTGKDSIRQIADSVANRVFFMGLSRSEQHKRLACEGTDSLLDASDSINFLGSDIQPMEDFEEETDMDLKAIQAEIKSKDLTKDRALALRAELEAAEDKAAVKRTLTSLIAKIRTNEWMDASPSKETIEARVAGLDAHLETLPEADRGAYLDALEADAKAFGVDFKRPICTATPEGTPAEKVAADATPATPAAEPAATESIDKDVAALWQNEVDAAGDKAKSFDGKAAVAALDAVHKSYCAIPEDAQYLFRSSISALLEKWYAGSNLNYYKNRLMEAGTDAVVAKTELDELHTAVEKGEASLKVAETDKQALLATNRNLIGEQKVTIARAIVTGSALLNKKGFTGLSADQIQEEISARSKRGLNSLEDSLSDLLKEIPGAIPAASESTPVEGAVRQVSDNAKVADEGAASPEAAAEGTEVATDGETQAQPLTRLLDPVSQRRAGARARFEQRSTANKNKE